MENFRRNNRSGSRDGGRGSVARMHKTICSECRKECEVPFKPTGSKPVFCSDCFGKRRNEEPRRFSGKDSGRFSGKDSGRFSSGDRKMYKVICDECGRECEVPFKPTSDKPIYCDECFGKRGKDKGSGQTSKQFELINTKLDKILKVLDSSVSEKVEKKEKTIKKVEVSEPKKTTKSKDKKVKSPKKAKVKKKK